MQWCSNNDNGHRTWIAGDYSSSNYQENYCGITYAQNIQVYDSYFYDICYCGEKYDQGACPADMLTWDNATMKEQQAWWEQTKDTAGYGFTTIDVELLDTFNETAVIESMFKASFTWDEDDDDTQSSADYYQDSIQS